VKNRFQAFAFAFSRSTCTATSRVPVTVVPHTAPVPEMIKVRERDER
jgi:hypothetical protein